MKFVIIETPVQGDLQNVLLYARWAIRDSLNRGEWAVAALGPASGYASQAERAVFYLDRGWTPGLLEALESYLRAGVPVERRWMEDKQEIGAGLPAEAAAEIAKEMAKQRVADEARISEIADRVGVEIRWVTT